MTLDREFRGFGVQRLAVVEFDARPELDRHFLAVGRRLVGQCQLRHDVELLVDVEQLVAECREHDAADIGAADRGIENVGILGNPDTQRGLCERARLERQQQCRRSHSRTNNLHRTHLIFLGHNAVVVVPTISTPADAGTSF